MTVHINNYDSFLSFVEVKWFISIITPIITKVTVKMRAIPFAIIGSVAKNKSTFIALFPFLFI